MRSIFKVVCLVSVISCLSLVGCKFDRSHSSSSGSSSRSRTNSISAYKTATRPQQKRVYVDLEAETLIHRWLEAAEMSIIIVDSLAPEWLPDELYRLQSKKPFLKTQLASRMCVKHPGQLFIPELKAAYMIIDFQYLIINPLYSSTDKGLTYVSDDPELVQEYLKFSQMLFAQIR